MTAGFFPGGGGKFMDAKKLTTFLVVALKTDLSQGCIFFLRKVDLFFITLKTQVFTVTTNAQNTLHFQRGQVPSTHFSFFVGGACVRRRGGGACAMAQWPVQACRPNGMIIGVSNTRKVVHEATKVTQNEWG